MILENALAVLAQDPTYKNTTALLHQAVTGEDISQLRILSDAYLRDKNKTIQKEQNSLKKMNPRNPLNYMRALLWAFLKPVKLQNYRDLHKNREIVEMANWAVSYMIWLPLLLVFVAAGIGKLSPIAQNAALVNSPYWIILITLIIAINIFLSILIINHSDGVPFLVICFFIWLLLAFVNGLCLLAISVSFTFTTDISAGGLILVISALSVIPANIKVIRNTEYENRKITTNEYIWQHPPFILGAASFLACALSFAMGYASLDP